MHSVCHQARWHHLRAPAPGACHGCAPHWSWPPACLPRRSRLRCHHQRHDRQRPSAAIGSSAGSPDGGGGSPPHTTQRSTAGSGGGGGDSGRPPAQQWLRRAAAAAGAFVLLGLLQPWRLLLPLPRIDTSQQRLTVIVPVLNEAAAIVATLQALRQLQPPPDEVIVVDGGSTDGTVRLARRSGLATKVLRSGRGRAVQMNAGAAAASGELLCFLHADTLPPADLVSLARQQLRDPHTVLAGFVPSIEVPGRRLWLLSFHNFISTYYAPLLFRPLSYLRGLRNLFGDQTLFCRACDFKAVGGFDARWRIMEDTDLCVRMHDAGPCRHHVQPSQQQQQQQQQRGRSKRHSGGSSSGAGSPDPAPCGGRVRRWLAPRGRVLQLLSRCSVTSGRRLDAWGPLRATYIHAVIGTNWFFTRDPHALQQLYEQLYTDAYR